jgi:hypothetical protein
MDDKSTPIENLNNKVDDTEVVNKILSKYNNLQDGQTSIPPLNNNQPEMEQKFENRNINEEIYNLNSNNDAYNDHYQKEIKRTSNQYEEKNKKNNIQEYDEEDYEDEYDEFEVVEIPLWKKILNEVRIPFFIFIFIILLSNSIFDKFLLSKLPFLGNLFNEFNTYGVLLKAFIISILSYIFIRFIRFK